jgi:hypothetical protein
MGMFTVKGEYMFKHLLIFSTILLVAAPIALASDREDDVARNEKAAQVFKQIMLSVLPSFQEIRSSPSSLEEVMVAEWQSAAPPTDGVLRCSWLSKVEAWDTR